MGEEEAVAPEEPPELLPQDTAKGGAHLRGEAWDVGKYDIGQIQYILRQVGSIKPCLIDSLLRGFVGYCLLCTETRERTLNS